MEVLDFSWRCWEKLKGNLFVWKKNLLKTKILKWKKRCFFITEMLLKYKKQSGMRCVYFSWQESNGRSGEAMAPLPPLRSHGLSDHTGLIWEMDPCLALVPCHPTLAHQFLCQFCQKWPMHSWTSQNQEPQEHVPQAEGVSATAAVQKLLLQP